MSKQQGRQTSIEEYIEKVKSEYPASENLSVLNADYRAYIAEHGDIQQEVYAEISRFPIERVWKWNTSPDNRLHYFCCPCGQRLLTVSQERVSFPPKAQYKHNVHTRSEWEPEFYRLMIRCPRSHQQRVCFWRREVLDILPDAFHPAVNAFFESLKNDEHVFCFLTFSEIKERDDLGWSSLMAKERQMVEHYKKSI